MFGVLVFFFSPSWGAFRLWSRVPEFSEMLEVRRGLTVLAQVAHPGAEIADPLHHAIQWRLLLPLIGRALHLPPTLLFGLAHLGALAVLGFIACLLRRRGLAWADTALAAITLGAASWFFTATGWLGYYDSWLALGLLVTAFARDRRWMWAAFLWAPWVDERFVLAAPLALLCRFSDPGNADGNWRRELAVPAGLLIAFLGLRFGFLASRTGGGATIGGYLATRDYLDAPLSRIALGVWEGLRGAWLFVLAALWLLRSQRYVQLLLAAAVLVTAGTGLATAQDYSRSMTMVLPAALLGLLVASSATWFRPALRLAALAALLLPAHHVMNDRVNPIFYLYHELNALDHPPRFALPEVAELRAIHAMQRGDLAAAEADLTLALRLTAQPASIAQQRGLLYASTGRWSQALADFNTMVEHDPQNPDAWFMRAQARLALGEPTAARADFNQALTLAPAGWSTRPDVTRFLAKLNRSQ